MTLSLFSCLIFSLSFFNILTPQRSFSDSENRFLEKFPKVSLEAIVDGKFNEDFQKYSADQFILRDKWIRLKTSLDLLSFKKDNGRVYFGRDDYLFGVEEELNQNKFLKNIKNTNSFKAEIDFPLDIMLIPTKFSVLQDKLPFKAPIIDEVGLLREIEENLDKSINLLSPIEEFKSTEEEIYYKTDHHYTSLGAYYAYRQYMEELGIDPYDLDFFKRETVTDDFLGSLFRKSNYYRGESERIEKFIPKEDVSLNIIRDEKEELDGLYDEKFLEKNDKYSFFLGGDHSVIDIRTSIEGGETLLLVKDSFANSMIPFLTLHFSRIIVIDERYFNISLEEYIGDKDIDRVLFLYNIRTFYDR